MEGIAGQNLAGFMTSRTRREILHLFLSPANRGICHYQREISYLTGRRLNAVQRELKKLTGIGFLYVEERRGRVYYRINDEFSSLAELRSLFGKGAP